MWNDLTMRQKAELMGIGVKNGITDLNTIKQLYEDSKRSRPENWKALNNIDYEAIPDETFTRERTGVGDIEYFAAEHPEGITYGNGYHRAHPRPGKDVILYNPKNNDKQDVALDALHIMPKDSTYDALNAVYRDAAKHSDVAYNAQARYNEDLAKYGRENIDSYEQYFNNEADGLLRNMFIKGSPKYIEAKRYYPNIQQLREWNEPLLPYIDAIEGYLQTGERPFNVLPELTVTAPKKKYPLGGITTLGGRAFLSQLGSKKPSLSMDEVRERLYRNISPWGYYPNDWMNVAYRAVLQNEPYGKGNTEPIVSPGDRAADAIYATYLNIPKEKRRSGTELAVSPYSPTIGGENQTYYSLPIDRDDREELVRRSRWLKFGKNTTASADDAGDSEFASKYNLGTFTIGRGLDPHKGEYASYYDKFDLNPTYGQYSVNWRDEEEEEEQGKDIDISLGIGTPVRMYDRVYLNDFYGVNPEDLRMPEGDYYGGWQPEVTITRKKPNTKRKK